MGFIKRCIEVNGFIADLVIKKKGKINMKKLSFLLILIPLLLMYSCCNFNLHEDDYFIKEKKDFIISVMNNPEKYDSLLQANNGINTIDIFKFYESYNDMVSTTSDITEIVRDHFDDGFKFLYDDKREIFDFRSRTIVYDHDFVITKKDFSCWDMYFGDFYKPFLTFRFRLENGTWKYIGYTWDGNYSEMIRQRKLKSKDE